MSTKRIKLLTVLLVVFAAAMLAFAGCKIGEPNAQDILDQNKTTARVIYYANSGRFNDSDNHTISIYYRANTPVLDILQKDSIPDSGYPTKIYVACTNYILSGWEYAELDQNGNPVFLDTDGRTLHIHVFTEDEGDVEFPKDGNGAPLAVTAFDNEDGELVFKDETLLTVKSSGKAVDFTQKISNGGKWYFVANWIADVRLNYVLVSDSEVKVPVLDADNNPTYDENNNPVEKVYNNGDVITQAFYGKGSSVRVSTYAPSASNATYLQAYSDAECKNAVETVAKPTDGKDATVYVKYLDGKWDVIKTALEVSNMFSNLGNATRQFYILNDIDCSNITVTPVTTVKCTIEGNGSTLKNLKASRASINPGESVSLFGTISQDARISNLNFENLSVTLKTRSGFVDLFMFCTNVEEGAEISGVTFKNATMIFDDADRNTTVNNIPYANGAYSSGYWMFGGLDSDEAFMQRYGITVNGYSLKHITDSFNNTTEDVVFVEAN